MDGDCRRTSTAAVMPGKLTPGTPSNCRQQQPVPVDGALLVEVVGHAQPDILAFAHGNRISGPGTLAVDSDGVRRPAIDADLGVTDVGLMSVPLTLVRAGASRPGLTRCARTGSASPWRRRRAANHVGWEEAGHAGPIGMVRAAPAAAVPHGRRGSAVLDDGVGTGRRWRRFRRAGGQAASSKLIGTVSPDRPCSIAAASAAAVSAGVCRIGFDEHVADLVGQPASCSTAAWNSGHVRVLAAVDPFNATGPWFPALLIELSSPTRPLRSPPTVSESGLAAHQQLDQRVANLLFGRQPDCSLPAEHRCGAL